MASENETVKPKALAVEPKSSPFVTVACKIGVAWLDLQICEERDIFENTQTGPRQIKQWVKTGQIVRIRGTAYPRGQAPDGFPDKPEMAEGYALTPNVPREFWEQWVSQNKRAPYVLSGMLFAHGAVNDVKVHATDHRTDLSGIEPIKREKIEGVDTIVDGRMARSTNQHVTGVQAGSRTAV